MKRYRSPLILTTAALSVFCLVLLAFSTEIPAMGQTDFELATPSQASPEDAGDGERESEETEPRETEVEKPSSDEPDATLLLAEDVIPQAVQPRIATGSNTEPLEVVKVIAVPSDCVIEAEAGRAEEMISQVLQKDPTSKSAAVRLSDGSRRVFSIEYDYDCLEDAGTGLVMLPGTITPPDGCHISPELAGTELPVLLYNPEEPCELPVTSVEPLSITRILLPEHAVLDDLIQEIKSERSVDYILEGGLNWSAEISWNFDAVDFGTPGTYQITARPLLPDGVLLPDGLPEPACDVIIQPDDVFLLGPPEFTGLFMVSQWTKETPELEKFRCFYAVGDGPWIEDAKQDLLLIPSHSPQSFQVYYYEDVFFDTPYYFQLSYDGEYSNILKVYFSEGQIHYRFYDGDRDGGDREDQTPPDISQTLPPDETRPEGTLPPETAAPETPGTGETQPTETPAPGHSSGDNSGGSGNNGSHGSSSAHKGASGNGYVSAGPGVETRAALPLSPSLPASAPPIPEPGSESWPAASAAGAGSDRIDSGGTTSSADVQTGSAPETKSEAPLEEDTADDTVYSGLRLQKYIELNPGLPLLITKHRIQVAIPMEDTVFTRLEDSSLLRVEILSVSEDAMRVELSVDGMAVPLDELPEFTITMPYTAAGENVSLQVMDANGTVLTEARATDRAHITFTVNQTGTFRIQEALDAGAVPAFQGENSRAETSEADGLPSDTLSADGLDKKASAAPDSSRQARSPLIPAVLTALFLFALSGLLYIRRTGRSRETAGEKHGEENARRNTGKGAGRNAEKNAEGISPEGIGEKTGKHMKNDKKGGERL